LRGIIDFAECGRFQITLPRRCNDLDILPQGYESDEHLWEMRYVYRRLVEAGAFSSNQTLHRVVYKWFEGARAMCERLLGVDTPPLLPTRTSCLDRVREKAKKKSDTVVPHREQTDALDWLPEEIEVPTTVVVAMLISRIVPGSRGSRIDATLPGNAACWTRSFLNECCVEAEISKVQFRCPGAALQHYLGTVWTGLGAGACVQNFGSLMSILIKDEFLGCAGQASRGSVGR
jgi:hypothetical protein